MEDEDAVVVDLMELNALEETWKCVWLLFGTMPHAPHCIRCQ